MLSHTVIRSSSVSKPSWVLVPAFRSRRRISPPSGRQKYGFITTSSARHERFADVEGVLTFAERVYRSLRTVGCVCSAIGALGRSLKPNGDFVTPPLTWAPLLLGAD